MPYFKRNFIKWNLNPNKTYPKSQLRNPTYRSIKKPFNPFLGSKIKTILKQILSLTEKERNKLFSIAKRTKTFYQFREYERLLHAMSAYIYGSYAPNVGGQIKYLKQFPLSKIKYIRSQMNKLYWAINDETYTFLIDDVFDMIINDLNKQTYVSVVRKRYAQYGGGTLYPRKYKVQFSNDTIFKKPKHIIKNDYTEMAKINAERNKFERYYNKY